MTAADPGYLDAQIDPFGAMRQRSRQTDAGEHNWADSCAPAWTSTGH